MAEISRTSTRDFYVEKSLPKIFRVPIDQRTDEAIPDDLNNLIEEEPINQLKQSIENSTVAFYDKKLKYNDKHLMILNLIHNDVLNRDVWKSYENDFKDAVHRSLMVADWLQSHTKIPLKARKISRSKLKFHSIQFPIHPEKTKLGSLYNGSTNGYPALQTNGALQINNNSYLSMDNVSAVLTYLLYVIGQSKEVLNDILTKSIIKKGDNNISVFVPGKAKELLNLDLENAKIFLTECIKKSFEILNKQNANDLMLTCYPVCKSGTYKGDYTYIFGFAILTWAYNLLKTKKISSQYKDVISAISEIKSGKTIKDILFIKKRNVYSGSEDPKITQRLEKIKQKMLAKASAKDVYSVQDYYKTESKETPGKKKASSDKNVPHIEVLEYERILEEEIAELEKDKETVNKEQIKNHAYIYPIVGRKIMLYTDINHFKYHINESVLSGIGVLMCLDLLPDDIFNNLKLCSLMSGGIFTLKLDNKTNNLGFVYDKKKPLITNMNDGEFSKYAQVIDLHPFCCNKLYTDIVGATFGGNLDEYDIESTTLLTDMGKYQEIDIKGDFADSLKSNLKNTGYIKLSHLFNISSDLNFLSSYFKKISDLNDKNLNWGGMIKALKANKSIQFPTDYVLNEEGKTMKGNKVLFNDMRKVQNVTEKEIRDALTWDLLLNNWVMIGSDKAIKFKNDLSNRFYGVSNEIDKPFGDQKGKIVIKTYVLDNLTENEMNTMPPECVIAGDGVKAATLLKSIQEVSNGIQNMDKKQIKILVDMMITYVVKFHTEKGQTIPMVKMDKVKNILSQFDPTTLGLYLNNSANEIASEGQLPNPYEFFKKMSNKGNAGSSIMNSPRRSTSQITIPSTPPHSGSQVDVKQQQGMNISGDLHN